MESKAGEAGKSEDLLLELVFQASSPMIIIPKILIVSKGIYYFTQVK